MKVNINPKTPTKISDSSCAVFSKNISQLITFTDSEGNKLETSYANSIITIFNEGSIFARSHDKEVELTVTRPQGLKGDKGDKGDTGEKGDAFTYTDFTPTQLAGLKGDKGDKGEQGEQGAAGTDGADATNETVKNQKTGLNTKIWIGTQSEYDAVVTKDSDTLYMVK